MSDDVGKRLKGAAEYHRVLGNEPLAELLEAAERALREAREALQKIANELRAAVPTHDATGEKR